MSIGMEWQNSIDTGDYHDGVRSGDSLWTIRIGFGEEDDEEDELEDTEAERETETGASWTFPASKDSSSSGKTARIPMEPGGPKEKPYF